MKSERLFSFISIILLLVACKDEDEASTKAPILSSTLTNWQNWSLNTKYEFTEDGRQSRIEWQRETGAVTAGKDVFSYNENNKVISLSRSVTGLVDETISYVWMDDKIIASKNYSNGQQYAFSIYDYNEKGQLIASVYMIRDEGGIGYLRKTENSYTYSNDGNLFQVYEYNFNAERLELELVSVKTYLGYISGSSNPVDDYEILPNVKLQHALPTGYTIATTSGVTEYKVQYVLKSNQYPQEKKVTSEGVEPLVTQYFYK
ncbi:hypothetical protein [Chryseosolibacter indicus]|uniref:DUF4595 domain-containing protein n=1 Tax=Chryseosolibacter indicus TaxID=2782351 RepID=A0ABS5VVE2_9BACT|nr:hypothetical protein [Chryseosolibacter indicus]MBT1704780.1 hypothetical protein [Chryseosolibacter indicus]